MLMLTLSVHAKTFLLPVKEIVEIVPCVLLTTLPKQPHYVAGMFNYRGNTAFCLDLAQLFYAATDPITLNTRIILLEKKQKATVQLIGLIVSQILDTLSLEETNSTPLSEVEKRHLPYLDRFFLHKGEILPALSLHYLLYALFESTAAHESGGKNET